MTIADDEINVLEIRSKSGISACVQARLHVQQAKRLRNLRGGEETKQATKMHEVSIMATSRWCGAYHLRISRNTAQINRLGKIAVGAKEALGDLVSIRQY